MKKITKAILEIRDRWCDEDGTTPADINNGSCDSFAAAVADRCPEAEVVCGQGGAHFYLRLDGLLYDSETPHGVRKESQLPFFRRRPGESKCSK